MAIQWSGVSGRMQVGIDVRTSGYDTNTPSITVWVDVWVRVVNWRYTDDQVAYLRGSVAADYAYALNEPSTGTREYVVGTYTIPGQTQSYSGGPAYTFSASIGGAYDGSAPAITIGWLLPPRPANVPTRPGISVSEVTSSSALITVTAADGRGAGIDAYDQEVYLQGGQAPVRSWRGGTGRVFDLTRATQYAARSRAHNAAGWGEWTDWAGFTTLPSVPSSVQALAVVGSPGPSDVTLSWLPPADDGGSARTGYYLETSTTEDFSGGVVGASGPASATGRTITGLAPGARYWFRVRAINAVGNGSWSGTVSAETLSRNRVKVPGLGWTPVRVWVKVPGVGWRTVRVWKRPPGGSWTM